MTAHLAHKIPWTMLCDLEVERREVSLNRESTPVQAKKLAHVARVLAQTLREFKRTATTTPEELAQLDPRNWGISYENSIGGYTGYYDSLLSGYMELNMLLTDPNRMEPVLRDYRGMCTFNMSVLLGSHDGGHPAAIANRLAPAFDGGYLKPLTADVLQTVRDHAALLFRCMFLMTGDNKFLNEEWMITKIWSHFGIFSPYPIDIV